MRCHVLGTWYRAGKSLLRAVYLGAINPTTPRGEEHLSMGYPTPPTNPPPNQPSGEGYGNPRKVRIPCTLH
jgi:hypothetical protein